MFWNRVRNGPSRSSKVVYFGTNRKRLCDFLLVISSNLGPVLPRFRDVAGFLLRRATPPIFRPNFRDVPLGIDCRCCGSEERRPKLIIRVINFEIVQHYAYRTSTSQPDRQTDGRTTYDSNTALAVRALRGKNWNSVYPSYIHAQCLSWNQLKQKKITTENKFWSFSIGALWHCTVSICDFAVFLK